MGQKKRSAKGAARRKQTSKAGRKDRPKTGTPKASRSNKAVAASAPTGRGTKTSAKRSQGGGERRPRQTSTSRAPVVIDAVVHAETVDQRATFEAATQATRSWVLLDEGFSASRGEERMDALAMARLRAHVLVMRHGRFAQGDLYSSLAEDAEALVGEHLRAWMNALPANEVARIVLCAHDVFAPEEETLRLARHQAGWWLANGVYPIHVLWESGFNETLGQLLDAARTRVLGPNSSLEGGVDPLLEGAVRVLGGPTLWAGVKRGAERAFDGDGGGRRLLNLLRDELAKAPRPVELHLIADGAGAGFQGQVIRHLASNRMLPARTLSLLAPAMSVGEFRGSIAPFIGSAVRHLSLFTLARDLERAERCGCYGKSFLSLLRGSLEEATSAEVLGLEESLRRSPDVARLFGLAGASGAPGEALFAGIAPGITEAGTTSGFVDDTATMNSALRRVLDQPLGGIIGYQPVGSGPRSPESTLDRRLEEEFDRRGIDFAWVRARLLAPSVPSENATWTRESVAEDVDDVTPVQPSVDLEPCECAADGLEGDELRWAGNGVPHVEVLVTSPETLSASDAVTIGRQDARPAIASREPGASFGGEEGTRRALCIGIDRYAGRPLNGATADALLWNETFARLGFETREPLLDADATRSAVLAGIRTILGESQAGDTVAIHFSGCGAMVCDAWEEEGADGPGRLFEALVPFDFDGGAFILGGDLAELLRDAPEGVHVSIVLDCSFAGGTSRIHGAHLGEDREETPDEDAERDTDIDPLRRTMRVSESLGARHVAFRRRMGQLLRPGAGWDESPAGASALFFLAARADECAWERDGYGDFSLAATRILRTDAAANGSHRHAVGHGLTNEGFLEAVREILSESSAQRPELQCLGVSRAAPIFRVQRSVSAPLAK
ncbi:MAG: caspase family protein [Phycisphaerae bacterium]|nr:caspase family protein [Phycisphaerae bacterium]